MTETILKAIPLMLAGLGLGWLQDAVVEYWG